MMLCHLHSITYLYVDDVVFYYDAPSTSLAIEQLQLALNSLYIVLLILNLF